MAASRSRFRVIRLDTENLFGSTVTITPVEPLYLPGTIFIVACLFTIVLHRMSGAAIGRAVQAIGAG